MPTEDFVFEAIVSINPNGSVQVGAAPAEPPSRGNPQKKKANQA